MMKGTIIDGVPHVLLPLPKLHELLHMAFGDDKLIHTEPVARPPTAAELDAAYVSADIRAAERGAFDYEVLRREAAEYEWSKRASATDDYPIGEYEYLHRWMW